MKKIISLVLVLIIIGFGAVVWLKPAIMPVSVSTPTLVPTPTPTPMPQAQIKLLSSLTTAKIGQKIEMDLVVEPLRPQVIDGLDIVFDTEVKFQSPTSLLKLVRNLQQNGKTIISFAALETTTGFNLNQALPLGKVIFTARQAGSFDFAPSSQSLLVQTATSEKIPFRLQGINLYITP